MIRAFLFSARPARLNANLGEVEDDSPVDVSLAHLSENVIDFGQRPHRVGGMDQAADVKIQCLGHVSASTDNRTPDGQTEQHGGEDVERKLLRRQTDGDTVPPRRRLATAWGKA